MNPIARVMKRYVEKPLRYALPLLFIGALALVSVSACTALATTSPSPAASAASTACPVATATGSTTPALTFSVSPLQTVQLVGDSATHVYHLPSCPYAAKISAAHLVYFNSPAEAKAAGYRPCQHCNPPDP